VNYPQNAEIIPDQYIVVYRSDIQVSDYQAEILNRLMQAEGKSRMFSSMP
jgi:hypothetical protein